LIVQDGITYPLLLAERGRAPTALDLNNDLESIMTTCGLFHLGKRKEKRQLKLQPQTQMREKRVRHPSKSGGMSLWTFLAAMSAAFLFPKISHSFRFPVIFPVTGREGEGNVPRV
jgi:hypothetical protein